MYPPSSSAGPAPGASGPSRGPAPVPPFGEPEREQAVALLGLAIAEDLPAGDPTSDALFPDQPATFRDGSPRGGLGVVAEIVAREEGVLAGTPVVVELFRALDPRVEVEGLRAEGERLATEAVILRLRGPAGAVLRGERIALNFLQKLCGMATCAADWAELVGSTGVTLLDTRKTTPGWRALEKYAVRCGGATNHRQSLSDGAMIKDNHAWLLREQGSSRIVDWVAAVREEARDGLFVEVEVDSRQEFLAARDAGADCILLDNFCLDDLRWAVEENRRLPHPRPLLEASGGIRRDTLLAVAQTGVDRVSVGALTHSAPSLDVSLEVRELFQLSDR